MAATNVIRSWWNRLDSSSTGCRCARRESGLTAPRESLRLVQADGRIRLLTNKTAQDHTTRMHGYARRRVEELADEALVGFVLKKGFTHVRSRAR